MSVSSVGGVTVTSFPDKGRDIGTTLVDGLKMAATGALGGLVIGGAIAGVFALRGKLGLQVVRQSKDGASMVRTFERTAQGVIGKTALVSTGVGALMGISGIKPPFQP